jgi:hypothetical protein
MEQKSSVLTAVLVVVIVLAIGFIFWFQRSRSAKNAPLPPPALKIAPPPGVKGPT